MPWRAQGDNTPQGLNRYPEPQPAALLERLALLYGVPPERILAGRGSDEAIDLLVRAFCRAGQDAVVICPPTFGMYRVAARIQGADVIEVPLLAEKFALNLPAVTAAGLAAKMVFLCSPNNPTGNLLAEQDILALARELAGSALVVVDEAYVEFADQPSLARHLDALPNLVVLRTLSKAYALAGSRCGAMLAAPEIVALLRRIIPPYAISSTTVDEVIALTEAPQRTLGAARIATLLEERELLDRRLSRLPAVSRVFPSDANFLLVQCNDPAHVLSAARSVGLLLRDFSRAPGLEGCVRITVGTPEQNQRLLGALER
ncbi:MAG TPA: histidinol-phosphate transaminase, partial [Steroidobacteraceae bacterium]|nr:histidinol-phosphate transaminase [Steroidobacteraceae bacterium]